MFQSSSSITYVYKLRVYRVKVHRSEKSNVSTTHNGLWKSPSRSPRPAATRAHVYTYIYIPTAAPSRQRRRFEAKIPGTGRSPLCSFVVCCLYRPPSPLLSSNSFASRVHFRLKIRSAFGRKLFRKNANIGEAYRDFQPVFAL